MAAPNSKVKICNLSMDHLKQSAVIASIDVPTTDEEKVCSRWYDAIRRKLMRAHPWTFARSRAALNRNATAPSFGYADAYDLPNNFLNLRFIGDDSILDIKRKYEIEGRQILIDNGGTVTLNIGYTKDEDDVSKFDAIFVTVLALALAQKIAYKFTLKLSVVNSIKKDLLEELNEAKAVNGQDRPPIRYEKSKYITARRGLSSNVASAFTRFPE